jgi:hypothetical protein
MSPSCYISAMARVVALAGALVLIAIAPGVLRSFAEGPFPGFTGGFKEPTCQQCHFGHELNEPGGSITLSGVPPKYRPGEVYTITVSLEKAGLEKAGFQLTARFASGGTAGRDAGRLEAAGDGVQLVQNADKSVTYLQHTPAGTKTPTPGRFSWQVRWIAPENGSDRVEFDVAANASNADDSPLGDYIYTAKATARQ